MPRPVKCRRIFYSPDFYIFKPAGIPARTLEEVVLSLDEFEAIRLNDLEGLYQEESARLMKVSRQTFGNIIISAHKKLADALVHGKMLRIEGGTIDLLPERRFVCRDCNNEWTAGAGSGKPEKCPSCGSVNIYRRADFAGRRGHACRKRGFGYFEKHIEQNNLDKQKEN
jgi:predicted DNA-binding protein (UPF0251 family)